MLDPVGSTSWHNRHLGYFKRLDELLRESGPANPTIVVIGPGGVTRFASLLLNDAARPRRWRLRKLIGDAARYTDQLLRRVPGMPIRSLEPIELQRVLTMPHRLAVIDRSKRILAAVRRDLPSAECHNIDISGKPLPMKGDVVIAFNVICRLENPAAGMSHVTDAIRPGGLLLIDDRSADEHLRDRADFEPIAPKTHRKAT